MTSILSKLINLAGNITGVLGAANGGTGVTSVTTVPAASAFAGWDVNKNLSGNNLIDGYTTTSTAAGTTALTVGSTYQQYFTGTTTQTVQLPVTSTMALGQRFQIVNLSTANVTVQSSGGNTIQVMLPNTVLAICCVSLSGTGISSWSAAYSALYGVPGSIAGSSVTGYLGEQSLITTGVPLTLATTSGTIQWLITTTLGQGVWDVYASIQWSSTSPNGATYALIGISTSSTTWDNVAYRKVSTAFSQVSGGACGDQTVSRRFYVGLGSTQSVWFVHEAFFNTMGSLTAVSGTQLVVSRVA